MLYFTWPPFVFLVPGSVSCEGPLRELQLCLSGVRDGRGVSGGGEREECVCVRVCPCVCALKCSPKPSVYTS